MFAEVVSDKVVERDPAEKTDALAIGAVGIRQVEALGFPADFGVFGVNSVEESLQPITQEGESIGARATITPR